MLRSLSQLLRVSACADVRLIPVVSAEKMSYKCRREVGIGKLRYWQWSKFASRLAINHAVDAGAVQDATQARESAT